MSAANEAIPRIAAWLATCSATDRADFVELIAPEWIPAIMAELEGAHDADPDRQGDR